MRKNAAKSQYCEIWDLGINLLEREKTKTVKIRNQNGVSFWNTFKTEREGFSTYNSIPSQIAYQVWDIFRYATTQIYLIDALSAQHWNVCFTETRVKSRKTQSPGNSAADLGSWSRGVWGNTVWHCWEQAVQTKVGLRGPQQEAL